MPTDSDTKDIISREITTETISVENDTSRIDTLKFLEQVSTQIDRLSSENPKLAEQLRSADDSQKLLEVLERIEKSVSVLPDFQKRLQEIRSIRGTLSGIPTRAATSPGSRDRKATETTGVREIKPPAQPRLRDARGRFVSAKKEKDKSSDKEPSTPQSKEASEKQKAEKEKKSLTDTLKDTLQASEKDKKGHLPDITPSLSVASSVAGPLGAVFDEAKDLAKDVVDFTAKSDKSADKSEAENVKDIEKAKDAKEVRQDTTKPDTTPDKTPDTPKSQEVLTRQTEERQVQATHDQTEVIRQSSQTSDEIIDTLEASEEESDKRHKEMLSAMATLNGSIKEQDGGDSKESRDRDRDKDDKRDRRDRDKDDRDHRDQKDRKDDDAKDTRKSEKDSDKADKETQRSHETPGRDDGRNDKDDAKKAREYPKDDDDDDSRRDKPRSKRKKRKGLKGFFSRDRDDDRKSDSKATRTADRDDDDESDKGKTRSLLAAGGGIAAVGGTTAALALGDTESIKQDIQDAIYDKAGDTVTEKVEETAIRKAETVASEQAAEKATTAITKEAGETALAKGGAEVAEHTAVSAGTKASEKVAEKATTVIAKEAGGKALARGGTEVAEHVAIKGGSKALGKIGVRAIPVIGQVIAAGMAGYDAYSGFTDTEMQKEAFGLKEGEEASFGQKTSAAVANVVDLGGLGTSVAQLAGYDIDTADIAKTVSEVPATLFGGLGEMAYDAIHGLSFSDIFGSTKEIGKTILTNTGGMVSDTVRDTTGIDLSAQMNTITQAAPGVVSNLFGDVQSLFQSASGTIGEFGNSIRDVGSSVVNVDFTGTGSPTKPLSEKVSDMTNLVDVFTGDVKDTTSEVDFGGITATVSDGVEFPATTITPVKEDIPLSAATAYTHEQENESAEETGEIIGEYILEAFREQEKRDDQQEKEQKTESFWDKTKSFFGVGSKKEQGRDTEAHKPSFFERITTTAKEKYNQITGGPDPKNYEPTKQYSKEDTMRIIAQTADKYGINQEDFLKMSHIETGGKFDPKAFNKKSKAAGLFQFIPGTAEEYNIRGKEFNPFANAEAGAKLYKNNKKTLTRLTGRKDFTPAEMYLAHQQGAGGVSDIMKTADQGGDFKLKHTRRNILGNVGGDMKKHTEYSLAEFKKLGDQEMAKTFVQYWNKKTENIELPKVDVAKPIMNMTGDSVSYANNIMHKEMQDGINKGIKYGFGSKKTESGEIDCSGWVSHITTETMKGMNDAAGKQVFDDKGLKALQGSSEMIIDQVGKQTGQVLNTEQLTKETLKEGMLIGIDSGDRKWDRGRKRGIDHITQAVRDPETGQMMITESRGDKGVMKTEAGAWLASQKKKKRKLYGVDTYAMAKEDMRQPAGQPQQEMIAATEQPAAKTKAEAKKVISVATTEAKPQGKSKSVSGDITYTAEQPRAAQLIPPKPIDPPVLTRQDNAAAGGVQNKGAASHMPGATGTAKDAALLAAISNLTKTIQDQKQPETQKEKTRDGGKPVDVNIKDSFDDSVLEMVSLDLL